MAGNDTANMSTRLAVAAAYDALRETLDAAHVHESHGIGHADTVLAHLQQCLATDTCADSDGAERLPVTPARVLALQLAALLHDADDGKYFGKGSTNARDIMQRVLLTSANRTTATSDAASAAAARGPDVAAPASSLPGVVEEALTMISWVSTSKNANDIPAACAEDPMLLWPRWCDRLEAIGWPGVVRCWQYTLEQGAELVAAASPRPAAEADIWAEATPARFAAYRTSGGHSASMVDHYYDKLLHLASPMVGQTSHNPRSRYLAAVARERVAPMVEVLLEFGRTGTLADDTFRRAKALAGM